MPTGTPHDWTLADLELIWTFDNSNEMTVQEAARSIGISHSHWYGMRSRLQAAGGPQPLFEQLEKARARRYNRASNGKVRLGGREADTLEEALRRSYVIRVSRAGRNGMYEQYTVTVPPLLARPFIEMYGQEIAWEPREDGILLKPVRMLPMPELPSWLQEEETA